MTPPDDPPGASSKPEAALSPEEAEQRRKFDALWDVKTIEQGCQIFNAPLSDLVQRSCWEYSRDSFVKR